MNETKNIIIEVAPYLAPILAAIAGFKWDWIMKKLNIKREEADLKNSSLDNLEKNIKIYQDLVTDIDSRYKERIAEFEQNFKIASEEMKKEIIELKEVNKNLKIFIAKQAKSLTYYEKKYGKITE